MQRFLHYLKQEKKLKGEAISNRMANFKNWKIRSVCRLNKQETVGTFIFYFFMFKKRANLIYFLPVKNLSSFLCLSLHFNFPNGFRFNDYGAYTFSIKPFCLFLIYSEFTYICMCVYI